MNKLLRAGFRRLLKNRLYYKGLIFSVAISVSALVSRYRDIQKNPGLYAELGPEYTSVEGFAFSLVMAVMFAMAVVDVLFLGTEYSDGTVRNKIIVGHRRFTIYLTNYIVCAAANLSMAFVNYATVFSIGRLILPDSYLSAGEILQNCLCQCVTILGFTAILAAIAMSVQSKAGASVTALIMAMALYFAAMAISDALLQPEYREPQIIAIFDEDENGDLYYHDVETVREKNPRYVSGIKREIYEELDRILPFDQMQRISDGRASGELGILSVYSLLTIGVFSGFGIFVFRKKDLK